MSLRHFAIASITAGIAACTGGPYRVEIGLPDGVASEQVEVRVVESCGSNNVLSRTVISRGQPGMVLGSLPRGSYGVEALVYDADCTLVAEGCVMVEATGAGGTIRVDTSTMDLRDCRPREACVCTPLPNDAGPSIDAGPPDARPRDTGPDGDTGCADCNGDGRCKNLMTDRNHCGECGNACPMGDMCEGGMCR